ncbi:MAG: hypothetical protein NVS2B4_09060 [Ramlibacter sp.]
MNFYQSALSLVVVAGLAGCGAQAAETDLSDWGHAVDRVVSTIAVGHEISTSFAHEKAAAAPAEMAPSF